MAVSTVAVRATALRTSGLSAWAVRSAAVRDNLGAGAVGAGAVRGTTVRGSVGVGAVINRVSVTVSRYLDSRALGTVADRNHLSLAVIRGTPRVLPRLVHNLSLLADLAISSDIESLMVPPVVALLCLINLLAGTASTGAELGDVLETALARALLGNENPLVVTVAAVDLNEDEDGTVRSLGVALSVEADLDGGDGLGGGGLRAGDSGGEGGDESGLVGNGLGNRVSDSGTGTDSRDVDGQKTASGNSLTGLETVAAGVTTTEVVTVARALDITLVNINTAGVVGINLITTVASTRKISMVYSSKWDGMRLTYRKHQSKHGQCREKHSAQDPSERWSQQARK